MSGTQQIRALIFASAFANGNPYFSAGSQKLIHGGVLTGSELMIIQVKQCVQRRPRTLAPGIEVLLKQEGSRARRQSDLR
jgi:hypothetical protein